MEAVISKFGLTVPRQRYLTSVPRDKTIPYFNSGVVVIPKQFVESLSKAWDWFVRNISEAYSVCPDIAAHAFYTDQFALSLALKKEKIPHQVLPIGMNFPLHVPVHSTFRSQEISPYILHHHHRLSHEGVLSCSDQSINEAINRVNTALNGPIPPFRVLILNCLC